MKAHCRIILIVAFSFSCAISASTARAQEVAHSALFETLRHADSLLFDVGFNTCDITQFEKLVSDDFEFYHDESGVVRSKAEFINSIRNGLCTMSYKARRELVPGSLQVYPLRKNGVLYGAVQTGLHRFYALESGKPEYLTSTAHFTHLWMLDSSGVWKLSRVMSYDHQHSAALGIDSFDHEDSQRMDVWMEDKG